jgi:hypothetical protein
MTRDEEMKQAVQELLELIHKFGESSAPLYWEVIEFIKHKSDQIRCSHLPAHVEAPIDAGTSCNDRTNYPAEKSHGASKWSQADVTDAGDNRTQQHPFGIPVQDQGQELQRLSRKRKSPDPEGDSVAECQQSCTSSSASRVCPVRHAALQARNSFSGQPAQYTPHKRKRQNEDASNWAKDLPWLVSHLGKEAAFTAFREPKSNWDLISEIFGCRSQMNNWSSWWLLGQNG